MVLCQTIECQDWFFVFLRQTLDSVKTGFSCLYVRPWTVSRLVFHFCMLIMDSKQYGSLKLKKKKNLLNFGINFNMYGPSNVTYLNRSFNHTYLHLFFINWPLLSAYNYECYCTIPHITDLDCASPHLPTCLHVIFLLRPTPTGLVSTVSHHVVFV